MVPLHATQSSGMSNRLNKVFTDALWWITGVVDLGVTFGLTLQYIAFQDHVFQDLCPGAGLVASAVDEVDEADEVTLLHTSTTKPFQTMSFKTLSWQGQCQWLT